MNTKQTGAPEGAPERGGSFASIFASFAILLNAAAVVYGFWTVSRMNENIRWTMANALASAAGAVATPATSVSKAVATDSVGALLQVDLFTDFGCVACRRSVAAVMAAREHFGSKVRWNYHFSAPADPSGQRFQTALIGMCVAKSLGEPWSMYHMFDADEVLMDQELARRTKDAVRVLGLDSKAIDRCAKSPETEAALWNQLFTASAQGIAVTPTLDVLGRRIESTLTADILIPMIESALNTVARSNSESVEE